MAVKWENNIFNSSEMNSKVIKDQISFVVGWFIRLYWISFLMFECSDRDFSVANEQNKRNNIHLNSLKVDSMKRSIVNICRKSPHAEQSKIDRFSKSIFLPFSFGFHLVVCSSRIKHHRSSVDELFSFFSSTEKNFVISSSADSLIDALKTQSFPFFLIFHRVKSIEQFVMIIANKQRAIVSSIH